MKSIKVTFPLIADIQNVTSEQLAAFMQFGFCYIKLPRPSIRADIKRIRSTATNFFHQPQEYKEQWPLDSVAYSGYYSRQKTADPQLAEQVIFWPKNPIEPFQDAQKEINSIFNSFAGEIGFPLLKKVFQHTGLNNAYDDFASKTTDTFSFLYYPDSKKLAGNYKSGVNAHQDWGLITMLDINAPGLVVQVGDQWHPVPPVEDHIVVNLGLVTTIATSMQAVASHHEVQKIQGDRLSLVVFLAPDMKAPPIKDYVTGEVVASSYLEFTQNLYASSYRVGEAEKKQQSQTKLAPNSKYGHLFDLTRHESPDDLFSGASETERVSKKM